MAVFMYLALGVALYFYTEMVVKGKVNFFKYLAVVLVAGFITKFAAIVAFVVFLVVYFNVRHRKVNLDTQNQY